MNEDQGICRVCRGEPSLNHPLFHPCKCSGSIRFVHQDCLLQWLSHSKKKYCELCEHPFVFTPIYREDMPRIIPLSVICKQCLLRLAEGSIASLRFILVITVWLILLPIFTLWTWRFYFWSAENIVFKNNSDNITEKHSDQELNELTDEGSISLLNYSWRGFLYDCFHGQMLTAVVIIVFVAAYLFREWVIQNTAAPMNHNEDLPTPDEHQQTIANDRDQIQNRLEELRQELLRRRTIVNNDNNSNNIVDTQHEYINPYSSSVAGYHQMNINRATRDSLELYLNGDENDDSEFKLFNLNPPSGTQSPFASWRDYQQQDTTNSHLRQDITEDDDHLQNQRSSVSGTWRAREFDETEQSGTESSDYFSERINTRNEDNVEEDHTLSVNSPQQPPVAVAVDPNEEEPFDLVENLDKILEEIGMRGNLLTVLRNLALMALMISLLLCVAVWIPYIIGRSVILVRPISLVDRPIRMLQTLSDPMISFLIDSVFAPVYKDVESLCGYLLPDYILVAIKTIHGDVQAGLYYVVKSIHITLHDNGGGSLAQLLAETTSNILDRTNTIKNWELIRSNMHSISAIIFKRWRQCATDQGSLDRFVCTAMGYILLISIGSWYLSRNKSMRAGSTNETLRQQGVFLKVLFFIFLELVVFPTFCGVLLDISTLPLFTECSIKSRFHFVLLNPYSGVFLHWFVGTGFIFQFSVFITLVREVVRPGVIFFVRDPNDPHFHPVQDMVDQPILVLLKNLTANAAAYFMLIMVGMGFVTLLVSKYAGIYPMVWNFDTPVASLPIDLLVIQFLLPLIVGYIVPREFSKKSVMTWWHIVSRHLRLSSYMFGGRYAEEEGGFNSWKGDAKSRMDGGLARVPTHDNVPIVVPRRRMIVPVHPITLEPLDDIERKMGHPAASVSNDEERDTTIVYVPPFFYYRLSMFLSLIWMTGSLLVCSVSVVPLKLGRNLFDKLNLGPDKPIHDLYSFILGAYIMIVMSTLLNTAMQKFHMVENEQYKINWQTVWKYVMRKAEKTAIVVYLFIIFCILSPLLLGITLDLYVFMPLRLANVSEATLDIYLTMDWTLGVAGLSIFYGFVKILPVRASFRDAVTQFNWNNIDNLNIKEISSSIIVPMLIGLCIILIIPTMLTFVAIYLLAVDEASIKILIFRCAYPIIFCIACFMFLCLAIARLVKLWLKSVRDDTYLIGKRLHNLE